MKLQYWLNDSKDPIEADGWEPDIQTDLAIEFIKKKKSEPFCLFLSFGPPHSPYKATKKHLKQYKCNSLNGRLNVPSEYYPTKDGYSKSKMNVVLHQYYAMVTSLDECMGRINSALQHAGIVGDTIVVFTSDHGDMLGSQGHVYKQRPWEESIHVPLIVRYPSKVSAGLERDWIVSSVDIMPTLLGLCGLDTPANVQGMDYSRTFIGDSTDQRDAAFLFNQASGKGEGNPGTDWRGIRTKEWVFAYHALGDWVMYDLKNDPYELNNLIGQPQYADQREKLYQKLEAMRVELGKNLPIEGNMPAQNRLPD